MKVRVGQLIGGVVEGMPWLGTFHAIGVKILRRHAELVDLTPSFTVLDTDDQIRLLKQLLEAENIDEKRWPARLLAAMIDGWKNRGLTPKRVPEGESFAFANGKARELYALYQKRLKELNAADFGDLLLENLRLFQEHQDVLEKYQQRFRYMLVDEYQDSNVAQYLWLRLLAQGSGNICCVGDDDQSIYGWRGAEVDNILRFETDFPGAKIIRLERNYRSTGHILGAASGLIAHNKGRMGKTLRTDGEAGDKVEVEGCWDDEEEARLIGEDIEQIQRQGHALSEVAILVRASFQMRAFEDRFITLGLPYRVIGGPRFYERQEIRDATAYFEVTLNPANDLKFERIINTPRRGLGDASVKSLHQLARARGVPLMQAARLIAETEELKPKPRKALLDLMAAFDRWRSLLETMRHTELAELILDESGYTGMWQAERSPQAQSKLENLKELIRFMEEFDTLAGFLEHVSLVMDATTEEGADRVNLMTLHSAKGLEFDTVFLPGWDEGLLPHQRSLDEFGARRARGGAQARPCGTDARTQARQDHLRPEPAQSRHVATGAAIALHRRAAGRSRRSRRGQGLPRLRSEPVRHRGESVRRGLLRDTWLATRAAQSPARQRAEIAPRTRAHHHRRDVGRGEHGRRRGDRGRRPSVPPEIRLWLRGACRRQQAHRRFRQGRAEEGGRYVRRASLISMRPCLPIALAMTLVASSASAEPAWTVERSEVAYLFYGEPGKAVLTITCGQQEGKTGRDETRIEVEADKGTTTKADKIVLVLAMKSGAKEVPLKADICGGANECSNLPDGEIYRYEASVPGKRLALDIASKGETISIDAPGAKISAPRDAKAFKKFSALCLNW